MRRTVLIAALLLVSASAQAGQSRNLSLAAIGSHPPIAAALPPTQARVIAEAPPAPAAVAPVAPAPVSAAPETGAPPVAAAPVPPPLPAAAAPAVAAPTTSQTPKYVERPAVTPATTDTPKTDDGKVSKRADRRHHRGGYWTAGRIMGELQRYGVYW